MFWKRKKKDFKRPSYLERISGRLGYDKETEGRPALEFMDELAPPEGLHKFRKMKMNDPIVGGLLLQIHNIMRNLRPSFKGENSEYVKNMLSNFPGGIPWLNYYMSSSFDYGFFLGEKIWKVENGSFILKDVSPRFQPSIFKINDENGNVEQQFSEGTFHIPYKKCVHHMFFTENRSPFGTSILRHLYKPYYYKISVEASESVGIDRDLSGMPVMTAPEAFNFTAADPDSPEYDPETEATLEWAMDIVNNVRKDTVTGIVKPNGWTLSILRGENRTSVPTSDIISRYNTEMAAGVLENFLSLGAFATTNNANTEVNVKNFLAACDAYGAVMAQTYNEQIIKPICKYNDLTQPRMYFSPISIGDLESLASFFTRLVKANVITPTTTLEKELMDIAEFTYDDNPDNKKELPEK